MKKYIYLPLVFASLLLSRSVPAQHGVSPGYLDKVPLTVLPLQDNAALLATELAARRPGRPLTFATDIPVKIRPAATGKWRVNGNLATWRLRIKSPGAKSLNLGFSEYNLPAGAELYISTVSERLGPFTPADNEDHGQLWTPIVLGDELMVELTLPSHKRDELQLYLTTVNHDFEGVTKRLSGNCNLDVVCGAADGLPIIDAYRDIIRSVAAYTLNGRAQCTGFLVNNANQDGRPLFMTANHCEIDASNAASIVAYWNYENSTCRTPGSSASGNAGNGLRNITNSGARLLASYESTDFALTELDDPVNPRADAFFAGWSASAAVPQDTVITVHHPRVEEKRISFSFETVQRANNGDNAGAPTGRFLQVPEWSLGTTEGGSSGAPIFDVDRRVRGQLFGGAASCGNAEFDLFGFFHLSWTGGGTATTRLSDWLDPCGRGVTTMDGLNQSDLETTITSNENCRTVCQDETSSFALLLGEGFPENTNITVTAPDVLTTDISTNQASGGSVVYLSYLGNSNVPPGSYTITVTATGGGNSDDTEIYLNVVDDVPGRPIPLQPMDGDTEVDPVRNISWQPLSQATGYRVQLSREIDFATIVLGSNGLAQTSLELVNPLRPATRYYWRVRSENACGLSEWSPVYTFITADVSCTAAESLDVPVAIPFTGMPRVVAEIEITANVEVASVEASIGIEHTFIGDIRALLIAPSGDAVILFEPPGGGACRARNMYSTFSDLAAATSEDFNEYCEAGDSDAFRAFQPLESFAKFAGQSARGTWQLIVEDNVNLDGGNITSFDLQLCASGINAGPDLTVNAQTTDLEVCSNMEASATLSLGAGFVADPQLRVEAGGLVLDNYTFQRTGGEIEVIFSSWSLLAPGDYTLSFTAIAATGEDATTVIPLTVLPIPAITEPTSPVDASTLAREAIEFTWPNLSTVTSYTLEIAADAGFSDLLLTETTGSESLTVNGTTFPDVVYWRLISNNGCGSAVGEGRILMLTTTAVHDFGADRRVSVFPNPVADRLNVHFNGDWRESVSLQLYGTSGRLVKNLGTSLKRGQHSFSLASLPAGVYYLRISAGSSVSTERILVVP